MKVRVLTNSLASSDESIVLAGYMKRRRDLPVAGVALYELNPIATNESPKVQGRFGAGKVASLHAKLTPWTAPASSPACSTRACRSLHGEGLTWIEWTASGQEKRDDTDPETDGFKRWRVEFMSNLPIDWLL